jgi:acetyl-CoA C-acetyltransferase
VFWMGRTVILSGVRTPFGKFGGALSSLTAAQLGGIAVKESIARAEVKGEDVQEVILGSVLQGGQGQIPSRQAAREAGLPWEVKTETINKVCASGMRSVTLGDQIIRAGDEDLIVAGGMESMSNAPYILPKARWGLKMGDSSVKDLMIHDGLSCSFTGVHMGTYGNSTAKEMELSREAQDEWALRSHERAIAAIESGLFAEEIVPVNVPQRKGAPVVVQHDESPRKDTSLDRLSKLAPVFNSDGTITAGNAPGINDGAAALVLMSEERALLEGRKPEAVILGHAAVAVEAKDFPQTPGLVINSLLKKTGKTVEDIDLFEINEAFAAQTIACIQQLRLDIEKVNPFGGAIALGHPVGATGVRLMVTLLNGLEQINGRYGVATLCVGGGLGAAVVIERIVD